MVNILGINFNALSHDETISQIEGFLNDGRQHYIVTPNPEIILSAHQDEELFYILNHADLSLADGFGLKLAGLITGKTIPRLTGADLTIELLSLAEDKELRVVIANRADGLSGHELIKKTLQEKYPKLQIAVIDLQRQEPLSSEQLKKLQTFRADILFNTFGSPYQEKFIYHNLKELPDTKLAIGVGGAFDFITGQIRRAPKMMRIIGLEWLWRLIQQPARWKRIYNATIVFTAVLLRSRLNHLFYRPNVACLLYKDTPSGPQILTVQREDDAGHWQLPQGGTDGEPLDKAGAREIREELNTDKFIRQATFKNLYKYKFPPAGQPGTSSLSRRYIFDYKGQKQGLFIARFTGRDEDIRVNFWDHVAWRWVDADKLIDSIHQRRREAARIFLTKFNSLKK